MSHTILVVTLALVTFGSAASAQHVHAPADASHAGHIATSTLSAEEVRQLLEGEGMGLAKAAELHGVPGPKHLLELAAELALSPEQRRRITEVRAGMLTEATRLGRQIVEQERALDEAFRARSMTTEDMKARVAAIATLQGELRAVHLAAHLAVAPLLSAEQVRQYAVLRGSAH